MKKHVILAFATLISLISLAADAEFVNLGLKSAVRCGKTLMRAASTHIKMQQPSLARTCHPKSS